MAERKPVAKRVHLYADGTEGRSARVDSVGLRFEFTNDTALTLKDGEVHDGVRNAGMWHGFSQKVGDTFAGAKGDVDAAIDAAKSMIERLGEGIWVAERESAGPSTTLLVEAIVGAKIAAGEKAKDFTDERRAEIAAKLKGETPEATKKAREGALANPAIKAEYERIRAERAAKKAAEAAEVAKTAVADAGEGLAAF